MQVPAKVRFLGCVILSLAVGRVHATLESIIRQTMYVLSQPMTHWSCSILNLVCVPNEVCWYFDKVQVAPSSLIFLACSSLSILAEVSWIHYMVSVSVVTLIQAFIVSFLLCARNDWNTVCFKGIMNNKSIAYHASFSALSTAATAAACALALLSVPLPP